MNLPKKDYFVSEAFLDDFIAFEKQENLFDLKIRDHVLWDYLRYRVYQEFLNFKPDYLQKRQNKNRLKRIFELFISLVYVGFSKLKFTKTYEVVVVNYDRRTRFENREINIHFYPVIQALHSKFKILLIDPSELTSQLENIYSCDRLRWRPFYLLDRLYSRRDSFSLDEIKILKNLAEKLESRFGVPINLEKIAREDFLFQLRQFKRYRSLFQKTKAQLLLFCDNGNMKSAIEAAHLEGIKAVDYQHSLISAVNILYTYPSLENSLHSTLSDVIFTYGDYWNSEYRLPSRRVGVGFPFMEQQKAKALEKSPNAQSRELSLILISGSYSKETFIQTAMELADLMPELTIYYKLRLEDYEGWRERYPAEFASKKNIKVIDNNEVSLYEYFARCQYQIGVNSTALIEGMAFHLTTFILKTGWYEEMKKLYENGHVFLTENAGEIERLIRQKARPPVPLNPDLLFKNDSISHIEKNLAALISHDSSTSLPS